MNLLNLYHNLRSRLGHGWNWKNRENEGLLAMTRVDSRRVLQISTMFMIFFSIFGKFINGFKEASTCFSFVI
ncbi:unnamed protein product [Lathyrus oleraceus]